MPFGARSLCGFPKMDELYKKRLLFVGKDNRLSLRWFETCLQQLHTEHKSIALYFATKLKNPAFGQYNFSTSSKPQSPIPKLKTPKHATLADNRYQRSIPFYSLRNRNCPGEIVSRYRLKKASLVWSQWKISCVHNWFINTPVSWTNTTDKRPFCRGCR